MKEIKVIMKHLKEQHSWRLEDSECGLDEVPESFDRLKANIVSEIKLAKPTYSGDIISEIEKA